MTFSGNQFYLGKIQNRARPFTNVSASDMKAETLTVNNLIVSDETIITTDLITTNLSAINFTGANIWSGQIVSTGAAIYSLISINLFSDNGTIINLTGTNINTYNMQATGIRTRDLSFENATGTAGSTLTLNSTGPGGNINGNVLIGALSGLAPNVRRGKLQICGADGSTGGPHVEFYINSDLAFPTMQIYNFTHQAASIAYDAYTDGAAWVSSSVDSNFRLSTDYDPAVGARYWHVDYDNGIAAGSPLSWNAGLRVRVNGEVEVASGRLLVSQTNTALGGAATEINQADVDEPFINFVGTSAADATASISTFTTGNSIQGFVQIDINGTKRWMPFYDDPTS